MDHRHFVAQLNLHQRIAYRAVDMIGVRGLTARRITPKQMMADNEVRPRSRQPNGDDGNLIRARHADDFDFFPAPACFSTVRAARNMAST